MSKGLMDLADLQKIIMILDSSDDSKSPSIPREPVYGPSVQGLLDNYGYDNIDDYLSDFYFPSTDKEDTIVHTGQDPIHECNSAKSKAKNLERGHLEDVQTSQRGKERLDAEGDEWISSFCLM
ncbi:hypothetical protein Tco_0680946 [Tanacetum coccineum]|uniref:Uncharacterized protein n=1 Tax=Tanacetum coccineum TaxID=301880 RepID=A0ABQ4XMT7_9ASTR